eukprot:COSAG05_NODE_819_length_7130_cov_2.161855_4_plen_1087_part_01
MLLANLTLRHHSIWDDESHKMASLLKDETFQTYNGWCDKMGVPSGRRFLKVARTSQAEATRKNWDAAQEHGGFSDAERLELAGDLLVDIALWWLVWGEAANLRFTPELLCFVHFHCVRLNEALIDDQTATAEIPPKTTYLASVVQDIYKFMGSQPAMKTKGGDMVDSAVRLNYSDINEFFWSKRCRKEVQQHLQVADTVLSFVRTQGSPCIGATVAKWLNPEDGGLGKTYKEYRGTIQIIKTHNRALTFYFVMFYVLVSVAKDSPFAQASLPHDVQSADNETRVKYLKEHPAMFLCGLNYTHVNAANPDVCCTMNLDLVRYSTRNGGLAPGGAWELIEDKHLCGLMYPSAISHMPMLGFVISIFQLFKVMLFLVTDFHHAPRRPALILAFLGRVICSALLFVLCFRDIDDPHIVPKALQPFAAQLELDALFQRVGKLLHKHISVPPHLHLYVSYGYSGLYLLEEIFPPLHAFRVPWFSLHAGSKWLDFADGLLRTSIWSNRGRIGETLQGWVLWVITLSMKIMFSYYLEIRMAMQHTVTFWEASHCQRTSENDYPAGNWICAAYKADQKNLTYMLDMDQRKDAIDRLVVDKLCNYQCNEIINKPFFKWILIIILWVPTVIVFIMDTQIAFTITQTVFGSVAGLKRRIANVRSFEELRSRFQFLESRFQQKIATYRGNFGDSPNEDERRGDLGDERFRTTFFPCPRMTTFRACWDHMIDSMRGEDEVSYSEAFLFRYPPRCAEAITGHEAPHLPNQRAQCFGSLPLFLLVGGVSDCIDMFKRAQAGIGYPAGSKKPTAIAARETAMKSTFLAALNHHVIPSALSITWQLAVRLIEVTLKLYKREIQESDKSVRLTERNPDGIGFWLPNLIAELSIDYHGAESAARMQQRQLDSPGNDEETLASFIFSGKFEKVKNEAVKMAECMLDARLLEHQDLAVVEGVENMRCETGSKFSTKVDQGINPLCTAARTLQNAIKTVVATVGPVMAGSGAEEYGYNELKAAVAEFSSPSNEETAIKVMEQLLRGELESHILISSLYHLLKTLPGSTTPKSADVRRRMPYWCGTLQMDMPSPTRVDRMHDFSTLVPFYN